METPLESVDLQVGLDTAVGLRFDHLKQLATISMTAAGGLIALAQFVDGDRKFFIKIMLTASALVLSALLAFFAQASLVTRVGYAHGILRRTTKKQYDPQKAKSQEMIFELLASCLFFVSVGMALQALFSAVPA